MRKMESIIKIEDLTFTYPGSDEAVLKGVSLEIEKGDFLALVGNNGCGKSTLCKTINGIIPHFITGKMSGKVMAGSLDTTECEIGDLSKKVGYVYQDFENQIVRPTVLDDASYACLNYAMEDYLERGRRALELCALTGKDNDFIWQLSGGQSHLLALAGALSLNPDVLILDEPIAQLDPFHAQRIYSVLRDLNEKEGKTIIVIEHHSEYIAEYCRHVALMKDGKVKWVLPSGEALRRVDELEECSIFPPQVTTAAHRLSCPENRLPLTVEDGKKIFRARTDRPAARFSEYSGSGKKSVAELRNVEVRYRSVKGDPVSVFKNLSLKINEGDKVAIVGSNGAGKSTIMKLLVSLLKPSSGSIFINGRCTDKLKSEQLSSDISMVYQNPEDMFIRDCIEDDISFAMKARNIPDWKTKTFQLLDRFHLTQLRKRDGRLLSGGQMRRASLAIGIALNPPILLLDEPTANLDLATRKEIIRTLSEIKDITRTVMIATHDMQLVCDWADRIIVLSHGNVIADGSRDEIFTNRSVMEEAGIKAPEIFSMGRAISPDILTYTIDEFIMNAEVGK